MASALNRIRREPLRSQWLGTSIEVDAEHTWRANKLRDTIAPIRFLSLEPLLGPLPSLDMSDIG
jgi:protein gp37